MMAELKDLFSKRDKEYQDRTQEIFKRISTVTKALSEFLRKSDNEVERGKISWKDISLVNNNFVTMVGVISFQPGQEVTTSEGEKVTVTKDTADYFKRVIRLGIPYKLVVEGTKEEIFQFITNREKEEREQAQQAVGAFAEAAQWNEGDMFMQSPISSIDNQPFDLNALSEEQKKMLKLSVLAGQASNLGGRKN